jgi:ADP-ribose pyrophosphatase YjhB (NUDIX family)
MDEQIRKLYRGTLCIIYSNGKYLMRFNPTGINVDFWTFPGGSYKLIEENKRTELGIECASRETREESGVTPKNLRFLARIFFENRKRMFPGKTEIANFDYDASYFLATDYEGEFREIGPEGTKQGFFTLEEALKLPMPEGDLAILKEIDKHKTQGIFEGVIVYNLTKLESATFQTI